MAAGKVTNLVKRGGIYYWRARVPEDVRAAFDGRTEYKRSLKTGDLATAKLAAAQVALTFQTLVDDARRKGRAPQPRSGLTEEERRYVLQATLQAHLKADEETRAAGMSEDAMSVYRIALDDRGIAVAYGLADEDGAMTWETRREFEESLRAIGGISLERDSDSYRRLAVDYLKVQKKALEAIEARSRGVPGLDGYPQTPPAPERPASLVLVEDAPSIAATDTLRHVFGRWQKERKPTARTVDEAERFIIDFEKRGLESKAKPMREITKADVIRWKDALVDDGLAVPTVTKRLATLRTQFLWAMSNDVIDRDPTHGVKIVAGKGKGKSTRLPYSKDDLKTIFEAIPKAPPTRTPDGFWMPVLALLGLRREEIGTLRVGDIKTEDGIVYLDVISDDSDGGKRLKTDSSRRKVPVPAAVLGLGLLDYRDSVKKAQGASAWLFPDLKEDKYGRRTEGFGKRWGKWTRGKLKITDTRKVFHSLRHWTVDAFRAAGVERSIAYRITGHTEGEAGDAYGQGHPLKVLAEAVEKLDLGVLWVIPGASQ